MTAGEHAGSDGGAEASRRVARFGVVLFVANVARVAAFYERIANMTASERTDGLVRLDLGDFQLVVHALPPEHADAGPFPRREDSYTKVFLPVESLAGARALAPALGGVVDDASREWSLDGHRICDGHDPEGNVIQLRQPEGERGDGARRGSVA